MGEKMFKEFKEEMLKKLDKTSTTEELVFELEKYKKYFIRYHMGGGFKMSSLNQKINKINPTKFKIFVMG